MVVVGNAGIDTNVYLSGAEIDFARESNFTENRDYVGQAGGYTSRTYARLGFRTAFIGAVGDDLMGRWLRHTLHSDGICTDGVFTDPQGTARSINIIDTLGRRKNFYDAKGHMAVQPDLNRCVSVMKGARLAHFHIPDWARHLIQPARDMGMTVACDLQDVTDPRDPYIQDFIRNTDILFFSSVHFPDPAPLIRHFLESPHCRLVISGMGQEGCLAGNSDGIRHFPALKHGPPVIDTNGAGDNLAAGFLSRYILEQASLEQAVLAGQIAARHICSVRASAEGIDRAEMIRRIGENESIMGRPWNPESSATDQIQDMHPC